MADVNNIGRLPFFALSMLTRMFMSEGDLQHLLSASVESTPHPNSVAVEIILRYAWWNPETQEPRTIVENGYLGESCAYWAVIFKKAENGSFSGEVSFGSSTLPTGGIQKHFAWLRNLA